MLRVEKTSDIPKIHAWRGKIVRMPAKMRKTHILTKEAAKLCGVTKWAVIKWMQKKAVRFKKVGAFTLIDRKSLPL